MTHRSLIVVGASAGGVEALSAFVAGLPPNLNAAVAVVLHIPAESHSALSQILSRASKYEVSQAQNDQPLLPGRVYVAPPDFHLLIRADHLRLTKGPRVNAHRPSIDPLFFSAARWFGSRAIGVVLSGTLDDGSAGLRAISDRGGATIVQDPEEAFYAPMPKNALAAAPKSEVLRIAQMRERLRRLTTEEIPADEERSMNEEELREASQDMNSTEDPATEGTPSAFACPDCHGVLWELHDGELLRYRCRVGHAYAPETLSSVHGEMLEAALWVAYRALRENAALSERLATRAQAQGLHGAHSQYRLRADDANDRAVVIERVLRGTKEAS